MAALTGEFAAIDAIRRSLRQPPGNDQVWIGDDAAVLPPTGAAALLLSVDAVVAGVHADLALTSVADLGWKAVAAAVSDMAAMGADPAYALVSVSGPQGTDLEELYRGIGEAAERFDCPVVGGDLTSSDTLVVSVTVAGTCAGTPVRRGGAKPGDDVWVTGPLGSSAAGLRLLREGAPVEAPLTLAHARPVPRVSEGRAARIAGATAMIDVSDGLSADAGHMARSSAVGIELFEIPLVAGASLDEALSGGEDFELVFTTPRDSDVLIAFHGLRPPIQIGRCTPDREGVFLGGEPVRPSGWQHRW